MCIRDSPNPVKPYATQFLKNGKLLRGKIKSHSAYLYGILRAEMQEHLPVSYTHLWVATRRPWLWQKQAVFTISSRVTPGT